MTTKPKQFPQRVIEAMVKRAIDTTGTPPASVWVPPELWEHFLLFANVKNPKQVGAVKLLGTVVKPYEFVTSP